MNRRSFIAGFAAVLSGSSLVRAIPAAAAPEVIGSHAGVRLSRSRWPNLALPRFRRTAQT